MWENEKRLMVQDLKFSGLASFLLYIILNIWTFGLEEKKTRKTFALGMVQYFLNNYEFNRRINKRMMKRVISCSPNKHCQFTLWAEETMLTMLYLMQFLEGQLRPGSCLGQEAAMLQSRHF